MKNKTSKFNPHINAFFYTHKILIFLVVCFFVHLYNFFFYQKLGISFVTKLNLASSIFYLLLIPFSFKLKQLSVVLSFFEINIFSFITSLILSYRTGYNMYIIGMLIVVVLMADSFQNKRFIFMIFGAVVEILIMHFSTKYGYKFQSERTLVEPLETKIYSLNLAITLLTIMYITFVYVMENNVKTENLDYESTHDTLTGLYNRRYIMENKKLNDALTYYPATFILLDIDHFKLVNDTYGHDIGDEALKYLSKKLSASLKKNDIACRWGGEEFLIILKYIDAKTGIKVADKIRREVMNDVYSKKNGGLGITITCGVTNHIKGEPIENAVQRADKNLYFGKNNGRNRVISDDQVNAEEK